MNYTFEYENHVHLFEGFYNPVSHDYYFVDNITLKKTGTSNVIHSIPIEQERLKLILKRLIQSDLRLNKYDGKIQYPQNFDQNMFNLDEYEIEIAHHTVNLHKQLYEYKQFYYTMVENEYKSKKYEHKLSSDANIIQNDEIKVMNGGSMMLIKNIPLDVCNGLPKTTFSNIIEIYSEPLTNGINRIITNYLRTELNLPFDANSFTYISGETGALFYHQKVTPAISYDMFKDKYLNMYKNIDLIANSQGIASFPFFIESYARHFQQTHFENNSWKNRIMFDHLMLHKYAHNGLGNDDVENIIEMLYFLNLEYGEQLWQGLQFIHSVAHLYDDIYVRTFKSSAFNEKIADVLEIKKYMFGQSQEQHFYCFIKKINKHREDFLEKTGNKFNLPYQIKQVAYLDKKRQYTNGWLQPPLYDGFELQLMEMPYIKMGETDKMYLEDNV